MHTVLEKLLEEVSFYASDYDADTFVVNKEYVNSVFKPAERERGYSRFLL